MARISRDKNSNVVRIQRDYLHKLVIINLLLTLGLYYILLSGK